MIRMKVAAAFLVLITALFAQVDPAVAASAKGQFVERFDALDRKINNGEGYSIYDNEGGALSWGESYLLEAYLDMYEATRNLQYIQKFVLQADRVAVGTDRKRDLKDFRGKSLNGWGASKFSTNRQRMVHLVHTGMILNPMLRFAVMTRGDALLKPFAAQAERYVGLAREAIAEFEPQWKFDAATGEGTYRFIGDEPIATKLSAPMPVNAPLAMGRAIVNMWLLTSGKQYRLKAEALARYFRNGLRKSAGRYLWGQRIEFTTYPEYEDLSHAAVDVDFAVAAHRAGIVFTKEDMGGFARTLAAAWDGRKFSSQVDGTTPAKHDPAEYGDASGRWLELAAYDCRVYDPVKEYLDRKPLDARQHPQVLLGVAKLAKYADACGSARPESGKVKQAQ